MKKNCYQVFHHCIKTNCTKVQDVLNINKMKFKPYGDLVGQAFLQFNENLINNQDPHSQIENDKTPGEQYPNESDSEERETSKCTSYRHVTSITK